MYFWFSVYSIHVETRAVLAPSTLSWMFAHSVLIWLRPQLVFSQSLSIASCFIKYSVLSFKVPPDLSFFFRKPLEEKKVCLEKRGSFHVTYKNTLVYQGYRGFQEQCCASNILRHFHVLIAKMDLVNQLIIQINWMEQEVLKTIQ